MKYCSNPDCTVDNPQPEESFRKGRNRCRTCEREYSRLYNEIHREERKLYYSNNKSRYKDLNKHWYEDHKRYKLDRNHQWRKDNIERNREYERRWYKTNTSPIKCEICGKEVQVFKKYAKSQRFCSRSCAAIGENNPMWQGGISYEPYCPKFNEDLKFRIREFFNNECVICGRTKEENGQNLSCHHVEYNKDACCDGKPVHFAALCTRCHGKTNKDKERWENMLHAIIDEVYDGKSYYTREEANKMGLYINGVI